MPEPMNSLAAIDFVQRLQVPSRRDTAMNHKHFAVDHRRDWKKREHLEEQIRDDPRKLARTVLLDNLIDEAVTLAHAKVFVVASVDVNRVRICGCQAENDDGDLK